MVNHTGLYVGHEIRGNVEEVSELKEQSVENSLHGREVGDPQGAAAMAPQPNFPLWNTAEKGSKFEHTGKKKE